MRLFVRRALIKMPRRETAGKRTFANPNGPGRSMSRWFPSLVLAADETALSDGIVRVRNFS